MTYRDVCVLVALVWVGTVGLSTSGQAASVLSVAWNTSELVSVDPYTGDVLAHHGQLDPNQDFSGLARDPDQNVLYAASTRENLYRVDGSTGAVTHLGTISGVGSNYDLTALAYDDANDILLATMFDSDWPDRVNYSSILVAIDVADASVQSIVGLGQSLVGDLAYNEYDGLLYAQAADYVDRRSVNEQIVTIDPTTGQVTELFASRDIVSGFAFLPGGDQMIAWENDTSHHFSEVDLTSGSFTPLANSDASGVSVSGMIYKDFDFYEVPEPTTALLFTVALLALAASSKDRSDGI